MEYNTIPTLAYVLTLVLDTEINSSAAASIMVDEEILDAGLFNISLAAVSDTEEDGGHHDGVGGGGTTNHNSNNTKTAEEKKNHRTGQTEEQFQAVRRSYRAKVENGEVCTCVHDYCFSFTYHQPPCSCLPT